MVVRESLSKVQVHEGADVDVLISRQRQYVGWDKVKIARVPLEFPISLGNNESTVA